MLLFYFYLFGIFISSKVEKFRESGQINYFVARTNYKKYLKSMLLAHSLYILSIVAISIFIILSLGVIITGKLIGPAYLGIYDINFLGFLGIVLLQIFLISFFAILINGVSEVLNVWIKNKIIVQTIPFAFFTLVPMTISSTLGNIFYFWKYDYFVCTICWIKRIDEFSSIGFYLYGCYYYVVAICMLYCIIYCFI